MTEPKAKQVIPKGALLTISSGVYSDYYVRGVFRALDEIQADDLLAEWLVANPEQSKPYFFSESDFLAWVAGKGLLEPLDSLEWHVGVGYGLPTTSVSGPV